MKVASLPPNSPLEIEPWVLIAIAVAIVVLRCFARIQATGVRQLELDDWAMNIALILFICTGFFARIVAAATNIDPRVNPNQMPIALTPGLSNNNMTDNYRASLDPASVEHQIRVAGSKLHLIGWSLYVSTLWCVKLCIAVFYTRLIDGLFHMMIHIRIAYVAIGVSYVAVMATLLGACQPFHRHWQINPNPGDHCLPATSVLTSYVVVVLNVLTDLYLVHIPILILWNARISQSKKLFLIMLFSGAIFVIIASIIRVYFIQAGDRDGGESAAIWGLRETLVAFIIGNLPVIYGGIRLWRQRFENSEVHPRSRARIRGWPGGNRIRRLFSRPGRCEDPIMSEKATPGYDCATLTAMDAKESSSESGRQASPPLGPYRASSCFSTDMRGSHAPCAEMDSTFGVQVIRGSKVDIESAQSKDETVETARKHSRMDSKDWLGPLLMDPPSGKPNLGRVSQPPSEGWPLRRSILQIPIDRQQRESDTLDDPNDTKWFTTDTP
ncbi:hypothetical protein EPUS_02650 [Endocarpon pusillum Z07020]|uniref:Rhodopsin domain-containing protein n=1 Tax=Endocarpon pusillum (strain Z07020 / HMAS-L-300199) TaxID=1263415 RepID=U1GWR5_ENDPU|nr:uncharacterized protein EPUS_02650 [Endocarpon pusillum Z07020]ERF76938.1 hypothetical protein EPUS_02650 [Endocarpon pusillum Z07020]